MALAAPLQLRLPADTMRDKRLRLCMNVRMAVVGAQDRDDQLVYFDDQLHGLNVADTANPYQSAGDANLHDPLMMEAMLDRQSLLGQAFQKSPKVQVEATNPSVDAELAKILEKFIADQEGSSDLQDRLFDAAWTSGRDPVGIMRVDYVERTRRVLGTAYVDPDDPEGLPIGADERDPSIAYDEVPISRRVPWGSGCQYHVPDLADVYLYPATAQTIEGAQAVCERMLLTQHDLLTGIDDYGYDEAEVIELLRQGPTHTQSLTPWRAKQDATDGMGGSLYDFRDGYYECFLMFTRLPLAPDFREDANGTTRLKWDVPDIYRDFDMVAMVCPERMICFQLDISPYPVRPYVPFYFLRKPNRFLGMGIPEMLDDLQAEANSNIRTLINSMNIEATPVRVASARYIAEYANRFKIYPGAIIPEDPDSVQGIRVLEWARASSMFVEIQGLIKGRSDGLMAAQGWGQLDAKQRKNGEMQNVLEATNAKFGLYLQNFQMGLVGVAQRTALYYLKWQRGLDISMDELRDRFRFVPVATLQTATPEARLAIGQAKYGVMMGYFTAQSQLPPQFHAFMWHGARQVLNDMGERQPEQWIGPEPGTPEWDAWQAKFQQIPPPGLPGPLAADQRALPAVLSALGHNPPGAVPYAMGANQ